MIEKIDPLKPTTLAARLTAREWFAGMALQGLTRSYEAPEMIDNDKNRLAYLVIARDAVVLADALIAVLEEGGDE